MKNFCFRKKILCALATVVALNGCGDSDNFVFTNTNNGASPTPVQAPVAVDDTVTALGNAILNQSADNGVLTNDTLNGGNISQFDAEGSNGGTLDLNEDGSFTYSPAFGFVGSETFTYTLSNDEGSSTATLTLTSTSSAYFVNNEAPDGGNGGQSAPFDTLNEAIGEAENGDVIVVLRGDGTSTGLSGAVSLPEGVDLIGEGAGLILGQTVLPPGQFPIITGPIDCAGSNTISGFIVDGSSTSGVIVTDAGDVTITECTFQDSMEVAVSLVDTTGTILFEECVFEPADTTSQISLENDGTSGDLEVRNCTFEDTPTSGLSEAVLVRLSGASSHSFTFLDSSVTGGESSRYSTALCLDVNDTAQCSIDIQRNSFINTSFGAIEASADAGSTLGGEFSFNVIDETLLDGVCLVANNGTIGIRNNELRNIDADGFELSAAGAGGTYILEGNDVESGIDAVLITGNNGSQTYKAAIRNNILTGTNGASIDVVIADSVNICLDITQNTVNQGMRFEDTSSAALDIERFDVDDQGPLTAVNNFVGGSVQVTDDDPVSQEPGFCQIP